MSQVTLTVYLTRNLRTEPLPAQPFDHFQEGQRAAKTMLRFGVMDRRSQDLCVYYPPHEIDRIVVARIES
jgi:hypothetical protein